MAEVDNLLRGLLAIIAVLFVFSCIAALGWLRQARARRALEVALAENVTTLSVTQERLSALGLQHTALTTELTQADLERNALRTQRASLATQLELLERARADALAERKTLESLLAERQDASIRLDSDLRLATERLGIAQTQESARAASLERTEAGGAAARARPAQRHVYPATRPQEPDSHLQRLDAQQRWVSEQTAHFRDQVLAAAARLMEERGTAFTELNKQQVETVVAPFKAQLEAFRQRVDHIYSEDGRERGQLAQQIVQLTDLNRQVSVQADRLVNALTVQSKAAGNWGETILARILEDSGLRIGHEYALQVSIKGRGGETLQPDAVIYLPEDRQLVVDSKVSLKAWTEYCAVDDRDEAGRDGALDAHLVSIRAHLRGLSGKDYAASPDLKTVDFVIMFVPVEAALLKALEADPQLYSEAYRAKIILVSPSTLMAVVKLTEGLWVLQKRKESADEVFELGRKLYEKLTNFAQTFVDVGAAIEDSQRAYDKARGQLATGKGNAIGLAEKVKELGVTPAAGKAMPPSLLAPDGERGGPEATQLE